MGKKQGVNLFFYTLMIGIQVREAATILILFERIHTISVDSLCLGALTLESLIVLLLV